MKYDEYATLGEQWLPSVPSHWKSKRLKSLFTFGKGLPITKADLVTDGIPVISYGQVHAKYNPGTKMVDSLFRFVPPTFLETNPGSLVCKGDFIFADTSEDREGCGNCVFVDKDMQLFSGYHTIILHKRNEENNNRYLAYLFQTDVWRYQLRRLVDGVKLFSITKTILNNVSIILPPRDEQDQIVRYLDWKVARVNKLIHGYQREIGLLEEKEKLQICDLLLHGLDQTVSFIDPGIQNIDKIPSHWKVLQSKRLFRERTEFSTQGNETLLSVSKHYGVKRYSDLDTTEQFATIKPAQTLIGYKKVHQNDLAMNIMRARNGSYGISDYDGIVSPAYCVYQLIYDCNPQYIHYLFHTPQIISSFESYSYGIAEHRRRLYPTDFLRLYFPIPPKTEQNKIVDRVMEIKSESAIIIEKLKRQITLLREYRTRLISDVVTGQMDVRSITVPDYMPEEDTEPWQEGEEETEAEEDAE